MTPKRIAMLVVLVLALGLGWLFWVQNSATAVNLILKLPFGLAWDLGPEGVALPLLLLIAFAIGAVVSAALLGAIAASARARARSPGHKPGSRAGEPASHRSDSSRAGKPFPGSPLSEEDDLA